VGHQQARNLLLVLAAQHRRVRFVLRARDAKFCRSFDDVLRAESAEIVLTPVQMPMANAVAERWVRTVRAECLEWLPIVGRDQLEQVLCVYLQHDNQHRPHRALGLQAPDRSSDRTLLPRDQRVQVRQRDLLGGLVHEYRRAA
jgi:hypothetical protein